MAKIPCNFRLSEETIDRLKEEAKRLGCSQAEVIERWASTPDERADLLAKARERIEKRNADASAQFGIGSLAARRANAKPFTVAKQRHEVKE